VIFLDSKETISIPAELAEKLRKRAESAGFSSLSSYVTYILRQVLSNIETEEETKKESFTKKGEEEVKAKLRKLGYL